MRNVTYSIWSEVEVEVGCTGADFAEHAGFADFVDVAERFGRGFLGGMDYGTA